MSTDLFFYMDIRKDPMLKSVRVPSLLEPGSTPIGTGFHPYWNRVPSVLERRFIRIVTAWIYLMGTLQIFIFFYYLETKPQKTV